MAKADSTKQRAGKVMAKPDAKKAATAEPKKSVDKPTLVAAKPVTKPKQVAKADPLAPLPARASGSTRKEPAAKQ
jgi:hypothetical protein